mgnify:CR=1 FL=1
MTTTPATPSTDEMNTQPVEATVETTPEATQEQAIDQQQEPVGRFAALRERFKNIVFAIA